MPTLLQIYSWVWRWQNSQNRSLIDKAMPQHSRTFPGFLSATDGWMRLQMLATPFSNLLHRIGGDYRGSIAQPGWRTFMMICLHWNLEYMRLEIWCKIGLSADWCLCTALRSRSGACCCWTGFDWCQAEVWQCMKKWWSTPVVESRTTIILSRQSDAIFQNIRFAGNVIFSISTMNSV